MQPLSNWQVAVAIYRSRIGSAVKGLLLLLCLGTGGFYTLGFCHREGLLHPVLVKGEYWSIFDCLYFTTITLSTVGYGETLGGKNQDLHDFADVRFFTVILLLGGMIAMAYFLSSATAFFVEGDLKRVLEKRRMLKQIGQLVDHYIICGAGQTGRHIAEEITRSGKGCVVIDAETRNIAELAEHGVKAFTMIGDATKDETLLEAGIERAAGLAAALADDKDNLFLVISARQLNPKLRIISKAIDMPTRTKLLKAGADGVVASNYIGGLRMASELVRPTVVNFLDQMLRNRDAPIRFAEVEVGHVAGKTLADLDLHKKTGIPILAVRQPQKEAFQYNPPPETPVTAGTVLVVMGEVDRVKRLESLVQSNQGTRAFVQEKVKLTTAMPVVTEAGDALKDPRDNL